MKSSHIHPTLPGLVAGLGLIGLPLHAQTKPTATTKDETSGGTAASSSQELPALEVTASKIAENSAFGTKINTPLIQTPQSISVVTGAEMEERGVQNLNDAVGYVSGVIPESGGLDSRADYIRIRGYLASGLGSNRIYMDGLRSSSGGQWTGVQFDPFGLERVEVLKGPSAVLYGQAPPGGLLNVVSKRPSTDAKNSVGMQYGSHDTIQGTFDLGGANESESLLFRVVGLAREGDSEVDHTEMSRLFLAPSLTWNISDRTSITFLSQYQKDDGGSTYQFLPQTGSYNSGLNGFRLDRSEFLGEPDWNSYDRTQFALGYQFEHKFDDRFTVRQSTRYTYLDTDYRGVVTRGDANYTTGVLARRAMWGYGDSDNFISDLHLESKLATGEVEHTLLTGVDYYHSDWNHVRAQVNADNINIYNPVYTGLTAAQINALRNGAPQQDYRVTERQLGFYVQDQMVWGKLHGTIGVRHDRFGIDFRDASSGNAVDIKPDATTWKAGLLYAFDNGLSPYASYTTSFDAGPYTSVDVSNKPLDKAVESEQWEVGLKYKPQTFNALFTVSAFQIKEDNLATVVMASTDPLNPYGKNLFGQLGEARTRGVELEGRMELAEGLDLLAAYTYLDTEIIKSSSLGTPEGNDLAGVPKHAASLWLNYTFGSGPLEGFYAGTGVRYVGGQYGDAANAFHIPSYTVYDAAVGYDFGRKFSSLEGLSTRLSVTNFTDELYVASSTAASAAWYGSGRNVNLSVRYQW